MKVIGLTGGIAAGKSTVSKILQRLGATIVDADEIARLIVEPGSHGWSKIRERFGEEVFLEDGRLDRERLGRIVFSDKDKRRWLDKLTHPLIGVEIARQVGEAAARGAEIVVVDAALLFESSGMEPFVRPVIVVSATQEQQAERLRARDGLADKEIEARIGSQMPLEEKVRLADYVVDNSGSLEETERRVKELWDELLEDR